MLQAVVLALSLSSNPNGPVDITEQELTRYVNQKAKYQQQYGIPGLFDIDIHISSMSVQLAKKKSNLAEVESNGTYTLTLPGQPTVDGTINANFLAKPRYDKTAGAIYLDQFSLSGYQITPANVQEQFAPLVSYLITGLQSKLKQEPAYVLNTQDKDQKWLKEHVTGFEMLPGKLRLHTSNE